jgi:hypothetical protein
VMTSLAFDTVQGCVLYDARHLSSMS